MLVSTLVAVGLLAYGPATAALWRYWTDEPSLGGHGFLVAGLAAWLLYRARDRLNSKRAAAAPWALLLLVPCSLGALIFWKSGIQALELLMLPAVIWLAVLAAFGPSVARTAAVPIGYLYFAMPAWNLLGGPLQALTAGAVGLLAPAIGLPALVSGTSISFPNGARFIVTLACSGVGFLTQGLAVAVLLGELEEAKFARRIGLFASMTVVALVTNWVRVLLLLAIGYLRGMDNVIVSQRHLEFGYLLFVMVLVLFVWAVTRSATPDPAPRISRPEGQISNGYVAAVAALIAGPLLVLFWVRPGNAEPLPRELRTPIGQSTWRGPLPALDETWRPIFVGAHSEARAAYEDVAGHRVEALAVGYPVQQQGQELVNEGNSLLGQGGLLPVTADFVAVGESTYREVVAVDGAGNQSLIWSFYDIAGESFVVPLFSQLSYGVRALTARPDSALFAFRVACAPSCADARGVLESFLNGVGSDLRSSGQQSARRSNGGSRAMKYNSEAAASSRPSWQRELLTTPDHTVQGVHL